MNAKNEGAYTHQKMKEELLALKNGVSLYEPGAKEFQMMTAEIIKKMAKCTGPKYIDELIEEIEKI